MDFDSTFFAEVFATPVTFELPPSAATEKWCSDNSDDFIAFTERILEPTTGLHTGALFGALFGVPRLVEHRSSHDSRPRPTFSPILADNHNMNNSEFTSQHANMGTRASAMAQTQKSLMDLPAEIRLEIFRPLLRIERDPAHGVIVCMPSKHIPGQPADNQQSTHELYVKWAATSKPKNADVTTGLLRVNKTISAEALSILYGETCFNYYKYEEHWGILPPHTPRLTSNYDYVKTIQVSIETLASNPVAWPINLKTVTLFLSSDLSFGEPSIADGAPAGSYPEQVGSEKMMNIFRTAVEVLRKMDLKSVSFNEKNRTFGSMKSFITNALAIPEKSASVHRQTTD